MADSKAPLSWKAALAAIIVIEILGSLSGWFASSETAWFDALLKPSFMPPGWAFAVVWPILYALLGVTFAMVLAEPPSDRRRIALILFTIQLALNLAWSPIFFRCHDIVLAKWVIFLMAVIAAAAARLFLKLRRVAGLLLMPYLAWLVFAATLNSTIEALNPAAGSSLFG